MVQSGSYWTRESGRDLDDSAIACLMGRRSVSEPFVRSWWGVGFGEATHCSWELRWNDDLRLTKQLSVLEYTYVQALLDLHHLEKVQMALQMPRSIIERSLMNTTGR